MTGPEAPGFDQRGELGVPPLVGELDAATLRGGYLDGLLAERACDRDTMVSVLDEVQLADAVDVDRGKLDPLRRVAATCSQRPCTSSDTGRNARSNLVNRRSLVPTLVSSAIV
jgi:hypothetical protein